VTSGEKTADRLRPTRCLECKGVINAHSTYQIRLLRWI